jgi:ribosomal protein S18 acetylase RimI-like enzyme
MTPPEIPEGFKMRRGSASRDGKAVMRIAGDAYGEWSDGEAAARVRLNGASWVGVLEEGGKAVAYALNSVAEGRRGRVLSAAVDPEHWGRGLGQVIAAAAAYQLGTQGAHEVSVEVRPDIWAAARAATAAGFVVGRRGIEYRRPAADEEIQARREKLQVDGMKVRFGGWR